MTFRRLPDLERPLRRTAVNRWQTAIVNLVLLDFPVELLPTSVGFAAAADPGSAARPVPPSAGDRAGRAQTDGDGGVG